MHAADEIAPMLVEYFPAVQTWQGCEESAKYVPASQREHEDCSILLENFHEGQIVHDEVLPDA